MAKRALSEDTKKLFEQYGQTKGQPLPQADAVAMLQKEFRLSEQEALDIFHFFDSDSNGKFSMWEFQHFFDKLGHKARAFMDLFKELENKDNEGFLDIDRSFDRLKEMKTKNGTPVNEEELTKNLQFYMGTEKCMDVRKFINFMCGPLELSQALPDDVNNGHQSPAKS